MRRNPPPALLGALILGLPTALARNPGGFITKLGKIAHQTSNAARIVATNRPSIPTLDSVRGHRVRVMDDRSPNAVGDKAFDTWLSRCLREQCAAVVTQPVPQEWIDFIQGTREASDESRDR